MKNIIANNIIERFEELKEELEAVGVDMYFEDLIVVIQSGNIDDIVDLKNMLDEEQLNFLKDFDYQFYCLIVK